VRERGQISPSAKTTVDWEEHHASTVNAKSSHIFQMVSCILIRAMILQRYREKEGGSPELRSIYHLCERTIQSGVICNPPTRSSEKSMMTATPISMP
jgi:hypothetical protein